MTSASSTRARGEAPGALPAASVAEDRLTEAQFAEISRLVGELTGIVLKSHKREMIHSRLSRRLRALNLKSFEAYFALLSSDAGADEIGHLINAVTTNLTSFLREGHHFDHLKAEVIAPMAASGASRLRIWSSACSSGEEPYTIVMTALSTNGFSKIRDAKILATDLDTEILARAKRGVYDEDRVKSVPKALLDAAATRRGDSIEFSPQSKSFITFRQLNLLHKWPMSGPFDAIFCRNVLIYFDAPTKRDIVDRMANLLRPDGALYLGHSESILGDHPLLSSEGRTIYRRRR